jgi:hypothetical protein
MQLTHSALALCFTKQGAGTNLAATARKINNLFKTEKNDSNYMSPATLKRVVVRSTITPHNDALMLRLGAYVIDQCLRNPDFAASGPVVEALDAGNFLAEAKNWIATVSGEQIDENEKLTIRHNHHFEMILAGLKHIAREGQSPKQVYLNFFGEEDEEVTPNELCYFLSYRYSLTRGQLIKTFITLSTPAYNKRGVFEYHHVHLHGDTLRRARGILIELEDNYYFLGGSARRHGGRFPHYAEGIQIISVERKQFGHDFLGFSALYMTNNNDMRPMIGHSAIIPLGKESVVKKQSYKSYDLGLFPVSDLEKTIKSDLRKLKSESDIQKIAEFVANSVRLDHFKLEEMDKDQIIDYLRVPMHAIP